MSYFFDTYAIIELIKENQSYNRFLDEEIVTSILNIGELYYALLRDFGESVAEEWKGKLEKSAILIDVEIIVRAIKFRFENRKKGFSFIDCIGYILAKENKLKFLTGDSAFEGLDDVEFVR